MHDYAEIVRLSTSLTVHALYTRVTSAFTAVLPECLFLQTALNFSTMQRICLSNIAKYAVFD